MKKSLYVVLFLVAMFFVFSFSNIYAGGLAPGMCSIDRVGTMPGQNFIFATCPDAGYNNKYFRINHPQVKKELLATALTAISQGSSVRLWIEDDGSTCSRIYIYAD